MDGPLPATLVLGCPVGSVQYIQSHVATVVAKVRRYHDLLPQLLDPQVELLLMRLSLSSCRVNHLMRTVDPDILRATLTDFDATLQASTARLIAYPLTPASWEQAGLPLRMGGLDLTHSSRVAVGAFVSSAVLFATKASTLGLPHTACQAPAALAKLTLTGETGVVLRQLVEGHRPMSEANPSYQGQAFWTTMMLNQAHTQLMAGVSASNRSRLQCLLEPLSNSWLTPIPSQTLGLTFVPTEFRCLLRWHLGWAVWDGMGRMLQHV